MKRPAWLIVASLWALVACSGIGVGAENETDVRVIDLKIGVNPIGWKDNETIVIVGDNGERYARKDGAIDTVLRVMTINYKTGHRKVFGKADGPFCYVDGYISYYFLDRATDELWVSYGELGKETVRKIKRGEFHIDPRSCRPWSERPPIPSWAQGKSNVWPLFPPLGLVDCNGSNSILSRTLKARFHKSEDPTGVELPFSCYDVHGGFTYQAFKRAYFAVEADVVSPWPVGRDRRVYWLFPGGKVEAIVLPYSTAIRENMVPTARGIVAFGRPAKRGEEYGIYLVTADGTKQILPGHAAGRTSPDGCKVAILHDPEYNARLDRQRTTTRVTLKVLELCAGP